MNLLDTLGRTSTLVDPHTPYDDFNLRVFQSILTRVRVTRFIDNEIDALNVTRPHPFYNPMHLMLEILRIDTKLFNIMYLLNLHNAARSPITNAYYGRLEPESTITAYCFKRCCY